MAGKILCLLLSILSFSAAVVDAGRVLVLCPVSSPSHKNVIAPIFAGLAEHGHQVTVVSSLKSEPHANVRDVIPFKNFDYFPNLSAMELRGMGAWGLATLDYNFTLAFCDSVYGHEEFMALLDDKDKFDLVLMDAFGNECLLGFVFKLGAPLIIVSPVPALSFTAVQLGTRSAPSFVPEQVVTLSQHMNLPQRILNTIVNSLMYFGFRRPYPIHERIYRDRLGQDIPGIDAILASTSMVLSNSHFAFNFPRPNLPDVVEIGGSHCRQGRSLPKELEEFVGGAREGLILFSFGSIVKPHELPEETRRAFVSVFSRLKQRVLWKWTKDMPDLPKNVKLAKWVPQQDVLAHPNTQLFITHAGLLSTQEAIYHGVPIVAFPIFGDQDANAARAAELGMGLTVEILGTTEETIERAVREVLGNGSYKEKVQLMSSYFRDQPESPKERGVFWAEYVMRHKGAHHMQSAARKLNFFQYYCLDVAAMIFTTLAILLTALFLIVRELWKKLAKLIARPSEAKGRQKMKKP